MLRVWFAFFAWYFLICSSCIVGKSVSCACSFFNETRRYWHACASPTKMLKSSTVFATWVHPDGDDSEEDSSSSVDEDVPAVPSRRTALLADGHVSKKLEWAVGRNNAREACRNHFLLALSVGFWVAVFGLPEYSVLLSYILFGQRGRGIEQMKDTVNVTNPYDAEKVLHHFFRHERSDVLLQRLSVQCAATDIGRQVNIRDPGDLPVLVPWNASFGAWEHGREDHIWCGIFPATYLSNWPNVAQLMVFTVFKNTGTTINLAVQGVIGTVLAGANMHLMVKMFPQGARAFPCVSKGNETREGFFVIWYKKPTAWHVARARSLEEAWEVYRKSDTGGLRARAIFHPDGTMDTWAKWFDLGWEKKLKERYRSLFKADCKEGGLVYDDRNYERFGELVSFANVAVVTMLFLISLSAKNTIMFGLSWHLCFMMNFMNPSLGVPRGQEEHVKWFLTEYFVVEATTVLGAVLAIVATLVPCARLFNVQHLAEDLTTVTLCITDIWDDSVSYLFGCHQSAKRFQIETAIDSLSRTSSVAKDHISGAWWETFGIGRGARQRRLLKAFETYPTSIKDILYVVKSCVLSESFNGEHNSFMQQVRGPAEALLAKTQLLLWVCSSACTDGHIDELAAEKISRSASTVRDDQAALLAAFARCSPKISADLSEEQQFLFALSMWARRTTDFADCLVGLAKDESSGQDSIFEVMLRAIRETWDPKGMFQIDHAMFAARNWLSIMVVFFIGFYAEGSIFDRYSYVMPVTLSLLMVSDGSHHVEYEKCTHRLLGVTLGKCLPIVVVSVLGTFECVSVARLLTQAVLICVYITFFAFVYFNSDMWSYVGCLVAGFGVYQLMAPCDNFNRTDYYASKYKELGSVIIAIFIQGFLQAMLQRQSAQDVLVERVQKLTAALEAAFEAVFESDVGQLQVFLREVSEHLEAAKAVAPECDPKLQIWRGTLPPFSMHFCTSALKRIELIAAELEMILVAAKD